MKNQATFELQIWPFGYKSCVFLTNIWFLVTNIAFQFTSWHLGL